MTEHHDNLEDQDWSWILADGEDIWDALAPYENLTQDWDDDDER